MFDDSADLASDCVALALAQTLDLLGNAVAVKAVVGHRQCAQHLGLVLGQAKKSSS
ncbi:MAG TPA: hypothetical protein VJ770_04150 [Stellaceae bacterium]|nr:hypothetical protein [Stellaceae bacterium]